MACVLVGLGRWVVFTLHYEVLDNSDEFTYSYRSDLTLPHRRMTAGPPPAPSATTRPPAPPRVDGPTLEATEERRQLAARVLTDALLLGIVGDALLRAGALGANMTVWCIAIAVAMLTLAHRRYDTLPTGARWIVVPVIALSLMYIWRDAEELAAYNTLVLMGTFALLAAAIERGPLAGGIGNRVRDVVDSVVTMGFGAVFGMLPLVLSDVSLRGVARARGTARLIVALRSALIAIPLLLVFGALFASADPVFARIMGDLFRIDPGVVASHLVVTGIIAWLMGGVLRTAVLSSRQRRWTLPYPDGALGLTEVSVALGALALLFAAFVVIQLRYFLGGEALVRATAGMSYADYARRGFFELVTVSALVLPVLLGAHSLLRRDTPLAERTYRALAVTLLLLLAVIMYSALARMRLYQAAYGYSMDRLFATVFMLWLAAVFVWFAATVLRGRESRFLPGVLASGWGVLIALNAADPAGRVTEWNLARAEQGKEFDVWYASSLGADAAPALVSYLVRQPLVPPADWPAVADSAAASPSPTAARPPRPSEHASRSDFTARCYAARKLLDNWAPTASQDWRSWTVSRARARRAVAAHEAELRTLASLGPSGRYRACPEPRTED